jgi:hypothetical protein
MRKLVFVVSLAAIAAALCAEGPAGKVLYAYDEVNENSGPYIGWFRESLAARGIDFDEVEAAKLASKDLSPYDRILIHGMVMAFTTSSPIRDWLKTGPNLEGKKVSLFVTANRWFLKNLFDQLKDLLKKDKATTVDAVSMATKDMDAAAKAAAVKAHVERMK